MALVAAAGLLAGSPRADAQSQSPAYRVRLTFVPAADSFAASAEEYRRIWREEGDRMIRAMEAASGLRFVYPLYADTNITVNVLEVGANSGYRERPMTMRASYPTDTKRATLMHELGHRLMAGLFRRDEEEHEHLFLWLYDAWTQLYGREFADVQVAVEKRRRELYVTAWNAALASDSAGRARRWSKIRDERVKTRR